MCPVDAIIPPSKKKKNPDKDKKPVTTETKKPEEKEVIPKKKKPDNKFDPLKRHKIMWILVAAIILFVIVSWTILFTGGHLTKENGNGYFSVMGDKIGDVWETIKTDVFKIKEDVEDFKLDLDENINAEERRIKELEDKEFPQFKDSTRQ